MPNSFGRGHDLRKALDPAAAGGLLLASPFLLLLGYADKRLVLVAALAGALKNVLGLAAAFQIAGAILCLGGLLLLSIRRVTARTSP
jgi:hypothetical protein